MDVCLGFRGHLGWVAAVAIGADGETGRVTAVDRRRLTLTDPKVEHCAEPYHRARELELPEARRVVRKLTRVVERVARKAVERYVSELLTEGHRVVGAGVLRTKGDPPATLESALSSHLRVHMAEGHLFRMSVASACEARGIPVTKIVERDLIEKSAPGLGLSKSKLQSTLREMGVPLGSPWAEDQRLATLGAWLVLNGEKDA